MFNMKNLVKITLFVVLTSLFISGCASPMTTSTTNSDDKVNERTTTSGKDDIKEVATKSFDPCSLLTEADVLAEMKLTPVNVTKETEPNAVGQTICFYDLSEDDQVFAQLSVQRDVDLSPAVASGGMNVVSLFDNSKDFLDSVEDVSGLGDKAYYGGSGLGLGKGLSVLVKNKGVSFTVVVGLGFQNDNDAEHLKIETALAKKIIGRL